jgi:hypothetical protein
MNISLDLPELRPPARDDGLIIVDELSKIILRVVLVIGNYHLDSSHEVSV